MNSLVRAEFKIFSEISRNSLKFAPDVPMPYRWTVGPASEVQGF